MTEASSASNTVIGSGEVECMAGGEGTGVGDGGGGGMGRVTPRQSLGDKPAAIISRSNSSPTMMCPGRVFSSGEVHCPLEEASCVGHVRNPGSSLLDRLCTIEVFENPVG
jgi:hypothetical protein